MQFSALFQPRYSGDVLARSALLSAGSERVIESHEAANKFE
jgi:hypothetical protein